MKVINRFLPISKELPMVSLRQMNNAGKKGWAFETGHNQNTKKDPKRF